MCVSEKKNMKEYFENITEKCFVSNKTIWNFAKTFSANKNCSTNFEENAFVETFNHHYLNIVQKSCKFKSRSFASVSSETGDENVINEIIQYHSDHPITIVIYLCIQFRKTVSVRLRN